MSHLPSGPLAGIRVLDLTRIVAGPFATQMLGDLGAEIIKIEKPGAGDDTRSWGPPFAESTGSQEQQSAYFQAVNRNKKSVAIDISTSCGNALVRDIAKQCDVVAENFRVDRLKAYGLDFDSIAAINPKIVYCSITGFGQTGPLKDRPGYDYMIQAMGGLMSVTGQPDGMPGGEPMKAGVPVADLFTGMYSVIGILAALREAERTGQGQHIDISLLDCQMAMMSNQGMNYLASGRVPSRIGNAHPNIAPYQGVKTKDGFIIIAVGNDHQFKEFCAVIGKPDLAGDQRFATNAARVKNRAALDEAIKPILENRTSAHWLDRFEAANVACGPIQTLDQVFESEHCAARNMVVRAKSGEFQDHRLIANPLALSRTPVAYDLAPPLLGEDTQAVLSDIAGCDDEEIVALKTAGIIS